MHGDDPEVLPDVAPRRPVTRTEILWRTRNGSRVAILKHYRGNDTPPELEIMDERGGLAWTLTEQARRHGLPELGAEPDASMTWWYGLAWGMVLAIVFALMGAAVSALNKYHGLPFNFR